jgi:hypothetical protein
MPVPTTNIRTSHAVTIQVGTVTIGQIQTWAPNQSRTVTAAYELDSKTSGKVTENVPGNESGLTIQVARYDLFRLKMEEVWGNIANSPRGFEMIGDQLNPFQVWEKWVNPDNTQEKWLYSGCWFSQLGRNLSAQGDRIVMVNATLNYVQYKPY